MPRQSEAGAVEQERSSPIQPTDEQVGAVVEPLGRSAAVGTLWLTAQKWVARLTGILTIAILTRLVSPEEFGVVAAASAITSVILLLADMGVAAYLVQEPSLDSRKLSTGFWFSLVAGAVLTCAVFLAAPLIAIGFGIEQAEPVVRVLSLSVLITVVASVPSALLRRSMQFRWLALQSTLAAFLGQIGAVALALAGTGAWALVGQLLIAQTVTAVLVWWSAHWLPKFEFAWAEFLRMTRFGVKVVSVEGVGAARGVLEAAIISNALGASALGYYSIAQRLIAVARDLGATALVPVTTVVFAKVRASRDRLRAGYLRALRLGYAAVAPIPTFIAVAAPLVIPLMFGSGWEESVPVARGLAIAGILVLGAMIDHALHYGVGVPGRWFVYALIVDTITVGTTYVLAPYGLTAVAVGFVFVAFGATVARWFLVGSLISCPAGVLARGFVVAMVPVCVSAGAGLGMMMLTQSLPPLISLALVGVVIAVTHVLCVRLISRPVLVEAFDVLPIPGRLSFIRRVL